MTAIAIELNEQLQRLDAETAASLERLVRDALLLAAKSQPPSSFWPANFWERIRTEWGGEPFERPSQGEFETREEW